MNVYRLTCKDSTGELLEDFGLYASFDVACNAAEIDAEERFEVDDAQFRFPTTYEVGGVTYAEQRFPPELRMLHLNHPGQPSEVKATYVIEEIEVKELV